MSKHEPHQDWTREIEPRTGTLISLLMVPVLLVILLIVGCGDSGSDDRTVQGSADAAVERTSTTSRSPVRSGVRRSPTPAPPTESTTSAEKDDSTEASPVVPEGPVSFATAEEAYHQRRYEDATVLFAAYIDQNPENPWGQYMLGLSAWKAGELDRAEEALSRTVEMDASHVKGFVNLARVRLEKGEPDRAGEAVEHALSLEPDSPDALRVSGRVHQEKGEPAVAAEAYRRAIRSDPDDAWSMNNLGLIYIRTGDYGKALPPLARAVQIQEDVPVFQNNLGATLEKVGQFTLAAEAYRKAAEAEAGSEKASVSLARVETLVQPEGVEITDLDVLARSFVERMEGPSEAPETVTRADAPASTPE